MSYEIKTLNSGQLNVYKLLNESNDNYYVTGKAGTGKSYLSRMFVKNTNKTIAIVAPTGIAAFILSKIKSTYGIS